MGARGVIDQGPHTSKDPSEANFRPRNHKGAPREFSFSRWSALPHVGIPCRRCGLVLKASKLVGSHTEDRKGRVKLSSWSSGSIKWKKRSPHSASRAR